MTLVIMHDVWESKRGVIVNSLTSSLWLSLNCLFPLVLVLLHATSSKNHVVTEVIMTICYSHETNSNLVANFSFCHEKTIKAL